MKRPGTLLLASLIVAAVLTASCGKDDVQYQCQCCGNYIGGCGTPFTINGGTREEARARCNSDSDINAGFICELH